MRKTLIGAFVAAAVLVGAGSAWAFQDGINWIGALKCKACVRPAGSKKKLRCVKAPKRLGAGLDTSSGSTTFAFTGDEGTIAGGSLGVPNEKGNLYPVGTSADLDQVNAILLAKLGFTLQSGATLTPKGKFKLTANFNKVTGKVVISFSGTSAGPDMSGEMVEGKVEIKYTGGRASPS